MRSYGVEDLDYQGLIHELSQEPNYPFDIHVRNHLLAPFAARPLPPDASEQDAWTTYRQYRRGAQVVAFGDVPRSVLKSQNQTSAIGSKAKSDDSLWGVAVVFPAYAPGWVQLKEEVGKETNAIWHGMRVSLWISSEYRTALASSTSSAEKRDAIASSPSEESLLDFLFNQFVPEAAKIVAVSLGVDAEGTDTIVDLFAINDVWVRTLSRWTEQGQGRVRVTRANPCMTFYKSEQDALQLHHQDAGPSQRMSTIETEEDMLLVQQSNSLTFPLWYIDHRKHISVLMRDTSEGGESRPVAWGYAHDDLSLASLHVIPSHRRLGLGQRCVQQMMRKLIQAQKDALQRARCEQTIPTPAFLDTEMHKGASRLFFEAQGYVGLTILTWGSITVV